MRCVDPCLSIRFIAFLKCQANNPRSVFVLLHIFQSPKELSQEVAISRMAECHANTALDLRPGRTLITAFEILLVIPFLEGLAVVPRVWFAVGSADESRVLLLIGCLHIVDLGRITTVHVEVDSRVIQSIVCNGVSEATDAIFEGDIIVDIGSLWAM